MSEKRQQPTPESAEGLGSPLEQQTEQHADRRGNAPTVEASNPEALTTAERQEILAFLREQISNTGLLSSKSLGDLDTDEKLIKQYEFFRTLNSIENLNTGNLTDDEQDPEPVEPTVQEMKEFLIEHDGRKQYMFRGVPKDVLKQEFEKVKRGLAADKSTVSAAHDENAPDPLRQQQRPLRSAPSSQPEAAQPEAIQSETAAPDTIQKNTAEHWETLTYEYNTKVTGTSKGVIRQIPAGWDEIKPVMMEKLKEPEPDAWAEVAQLESDIQDKYGVRIIRGGKTPQESAATLNALAETLEVMPKNKITGRVIAVQGLGIEHTDGTLDIRPNWSADQMAEYMTSKLGLNSGKQDRAEQKASQPKSTGKIPAGAAAAAAGVTAAAISGSAFAGSFKQPKVTYDENGQADLPGLRSESALKRAGLLNKEPNLEPELQEVPSGVAERGELLEQSDDILKESLDAARLKYVATKRALDEFGALNHLRNKIKLGGESKQRVAEALERAQTEYEQARTEFIGANLELHLREQAKLRTARFEEYVTTRAGAMDKARGWWTKLGEINYYESRKNRGKEIQNKTVAALAKAANLRTAISLGLLGSGIYAGATAAGAGVLLARRAYGSVGGTLGSKGLFEALRQARHAKPLTSEQLNDLNTVEEVERQIGLMEARAMLSGANEETLLSNRDFQALLAKQENLLAGRAAETPNGVAGVIQDSHKSSEAAFTKAQKSERRGRAATTAAALAVGAAVGGGAAAKAADYLTGAEQVSAPNGKSFEFQSPLYDNAGPASPDSIDRTELTFHGKGTGATVEVLNNDTYVTAGRRGIEGALQDLKRADPDKYKSMIEGIRSQYPGTQAKDSTLIHRAIKKLAEENGYTVDGRSNDLSRIHSARVVLSPDASGNLTIKLDKSSLDFMSEAHSAEPAAAGGGMETGNDQPVNDVVDQEPVVDTLRASRPANAAEVVDTLRASESAAEQKIGPEQIEVEKLDFNQLFPNGEQPESVAGAVPDQTEMRIQSIYESALTQTDRFDKTSDALKHLLKDDYSSFMKDQIKLDARALNRIQKFPVSQFMQEYAHSKELPPKQLVELRGLADSINELLVRSTDSQRTAIRSGTIRQLLIRLASERMSK